MVVQEVVLGIMEVWEMETLPLYLHHKEKMVVQEVVLMELAVVAEEQHKQELLETTQVEL